MMEAFQIGNFKAFGDAQRVPLKPLTLIFGANSSGKSSILHGLLLVHHALETGELDVYKTTLGGDAVDLGGFRQYVHRRNADLFTEFGAEVAAEALPVRLREMLPPGAKTLRLEMYWGAPPFQDDEFGRPIPRMPEVRACNFMADAKPVLRFFRRADRKFQIKELGREVFEPALRAMIQTATTATTATVEDMDTIRTALGELAGRLRFNGEGSLPGALIVDSLADRSREDELRPVGKGSRAADLAQALSLFGPRLLADMAALMTGVFVDQFRRMLYLGPLRSYPARHLPFGEGRDGNWAAGGGKAWDVLRRNGEVREAVNQWLKDATRLKTPYELALRRHVATSDLTGILGEEFREIQIRCAESEGEEGGILLVRNEQQALDVPAELTEKAERGEISPAEFRRQALEYAKAKWPEGLPLDGMHFLEEDPDVTARKAVQRIERELGTLDDLVLIDKRTSTAVSHRDVGIGISQVLPVLVHAYADKGQIVAIEQPEIHLHPALQAELGDVFIESALGERKNTFVLETHSEHLILRVLRRVRETTEGKLPAGLAPIRPEDISVVFVEPSDKGAAVRQMTVTPDGDFAEPWPGGFFAERFQDLP